MTAQQLKNSILQMAVSGKLVPQDPNDEPASVLLERIRKEKEQLIKEGKIKKEKNPSYIFRGADNTPYEKVGDNEPVSIADEVPFDIPDSWEWCRLSDLTVKEIKRGKSPTYTTSSSTLVFAQKCNVKTGGIDMSLAKFLDEKTLGKYPNDEFMQNHDIVINSTGTGTMGRIGLFCDTDNPMGLPIVPDSHVTIVRLNQRVSVHYLICCLQYYQPYLEDQGEGSTNQKELKPDTIKNLFIPLPSEIEQQRIADMVTSLEPYILAYGEKDTRLAVLNKGFPNQLKKSILQMAIQGKLVPQDPSDEPASVLLERIHAEKERLIKEGKIKRDKNESVIFRRDNSHYEKRDGIEICIDDEIPFDIPTNWSWTRTSSLGRMIRGKGIKRTETVPCGKPCIRYGEIYTTYNIEFCKAVSFIPDSLDKQCLHFSKGDIVYTLTGENKVDIAKAVAFLGDGQVAAGGDLAYWTAHGMNPLYLVYYMASPFCIEQKRRTATGDIIVHISTEKVGRFLIPVPPLAEQNKIVLAIQEAFDVINTL